MLRGGDLELPWGFDVHVFGHSVIHEDREALTARAHAESACVELQTQCLGVIAVAVREHHHLVGDSGSLAPRIHDEYVVYRHASDRIDALGANLISELHEPGQMLRVAGRGERT